MSPTPPRVDGWLLLRAALLSLIGLLVFVPFLVMAQSATPVSSPAAPLALPAPVIAQLTSDDSDLRVQGIRALAQLPEPLARPVLTALESGQLRVAGTRLLLDDGSQVLDLATGAKTPLPDDAGEITVNNRLRRELGTALALLDLASADTTTRRSAAAKVLADAEIESLPLIERALAAERDPEIRETLQMGRAELMLKSPDATQRREAVELLAASSRPEIRAALAAMLESPGGTPNEPDSAVRAAAQTSLASIERRIALGNAVATLFTGVSLGSVLLLVALGLAITYGLIGVINMAHGELMMIGAYATYVVQVQVRQWAPEYFAWYPVLALPVAFLSAALVGVLLERTVIRFLYGRPLETLLATWGISLILIQAMRTIFGAQNVGLENPAWLSGGFALLPGIVLPYNRIAIILFAVLVLVSTWLILTRTRLGLFIRSVTQNRPMASCCGVPTARVDMMAFGLGSGIAGLGGVALSQIGNVGPDLGQTYIIDAFMVVVLGGVGQLAGAVSAAMGLGLLSKLLEGQIGAVLAKIVILVGIILFIQRRPQGLFALRGRFVDS
ncbi:urea ABC transporter permease subunit UrtB [Piscinibacterium candidicorallinum]|uniref:Urea ABC transporter permease subunit UrtB n=1 Tax=Piscinibacterium candidicorallinum TaxID=1793872 RepID=A0ABV7H2H1_9BURK